LSLTYHLKPKTYLDIEVGIRCPDVIENRDSIKIGTQVNIFVHVNIATDNNVDKGLLFLVTTFVSIFIFQ